MICAHTAVVNEAIDKIIPKGAELQIVEELTDGSVRALADESVLVPDFSSFDKSNEGLVDAFATAGEGVAKAAKIAGMGLSSVIRAGGDKANESAKKGEVLLDRWYEIVPGDSEDTEDIMYAIDNMEKDGYKTVVTVYRGTMHGYVLVNDKYVEKAREYMMMPAGNILELKKLDKHTADIVKRHIK